MSGTGNSTQSISSSSDPTIASLIGTRAWSGTIDYAFPNTASDYNPILYDLPTVTGTFQAINSTMEATARFFIDGNGSSINEGFSFEGFTDANVVEGSDTNANLRISRTSDSPTSFAFFPSTFIEGGDVWIDRSSFTSNPLASNYGWLTIAHEIGHALGLDHSHEGVTAPLATDHMQYTIMSYRSFEGGSTAGSYTNEQFGYAQSFMMYDIATLQHIYGAGFDANSGDTVYSWSPSSGDTVIDGSVSIDAGANRIFATIWDGGGTDTYDLSAYSSNLDIDLTPGNFSSFSSSQKAGLGNGNFADGNIYNALQYQGDARSLIENVIGGSGSDTIDGNMAANNLSGGAGNDTLKGAAGDDWLTPGAGVDNVDGGSGVDTVSFSDLAQAVQVNLANGSAVSGADGNSLTRIENVTGTSYADYIVGDFADNKLRGLGGSDWIVASGGEDDFDGGTGNDMVSYVASSAAVLVNLGTGKGFGGDAQGDTYTSIERATGSIYQDNFYGSDGVDEFRGLGGYDWFNSSSGGRDVYDGGSGQDTVSYSAGTEGVIASLDSGRGNAGDANDDVFRFIDNLTGTSFDDTLTGNDDRNVLRGLYGEDTLSGGGGVDRLTGGGNDDYLDGGAGWDYAFYSGNRDQYSVTTDGEETTVTWLSGGREGTDTVVNVEVLVFADDNVFL
jgi:serralysin